MPESVLGALAQLAASADAAEAQYRQEAKARQAVLERERIAAHRRLGFVRRMLVPVEGEAPAVERALAEARSALGWDSETEARTRILAALRPVAEAVAARSPRIPALMLEFEDWYRKEFGHPFHDLFDRYVQETPVVDF